MWRCSSPRRAAPKAAGAHGFHRARGASAEGADIALSELDAGAEEGLSEEADSASLPESDGADGASDAPESFSGFTVGELYPVYLEEILEAARLSIGADVEIEVGQLIDESHPEGMLRIERDEKGIAIYPTPVSMTPSWRSSRARASISSGC